MSLSNYCGLPSAGNPKEKTLSYQEIENVDRQAIPSDTDTELTYSRVVRLSNKTFIV